jgi:hypothetical protein
MKQYKAVESSFNVEIPSNSIKYAKIWFIDIQVLEFLMVQNYNFPQNSINICFHIICSHCLRKLDVQMYCYKSYFCIFDGIRRNFNWRSIYKNLFNSLNFIIYRVKEWINKIKNDVNSSWRFLMQISSFTAVEFRLCNIPQLTYCLIYYSY